MRRFVRMLAGMAIAAMSLAVLAQPAKKTPIVGYLGNSSAALEAGQVEGFQHGLREAGYGDGKVAIVFLWAEGKNERLPDLAAELVKRQVDVIVTGGTPATLAAKRAAGQIPIVMVGLGDPVGAGLVASLAKPGGNLTGIATLARELEGKRLELLQQLAPKTKRVAVLMNPKNPFTPLALAGMKEGAEKLGLQLEPVEVSTTADIGPTLSTLKSKHVQGLIMVADRFLLANRVQIIDLVLKQRLPGIFPFEDFAEGGGLVSYAPSYPDMYRRAAGYVSKILAGAKPSDLPIELPTKFELVINRKTARAIDVKIPESVRVRTDRVIE